MATSATRIKLPAALKVELERLARRSGETTHAVIVRALTEHLAAAKRYRGFLDDAALYGVETRVLNSAVKRNLERFPADFMSQLSAKAVENWRSQLVMSKPGAKMGLRRAPFRNAVLGAALGKRVDYTQAVLHLPVLHVFGI